jgi:hypothetical protein
MLQRFAFKRVRMRRQQVLKNAAFEWQEHVAKQMRVQRRQFFQHRQGAWLF